MLRDHRSHATGATQPRDHDGQVKQGEQEVLHARDRIGQTSGATPRCLILESARELGIRDAQDLVGWHRAGQGRFVQQRLNGESSVRWDWFSSDTRNVLCPVLILADTREPKTCPKAIDMLKSNDYTCFHMSNQLPKEA